MTALYKSGEFSLRQIGERYGICFERVRQICGYVGGIDHQEVKKLVRQRRVKWLIKKYGSLEAYEVAVRQKEEKRKRIEADNFLKASRTDKWHWKYDCCVDCGTTEKSGHKVGGRCQTCYQRFLYRTSPTRKARHMIAVHNWTEKNKDKVKAWNKKYHKIYNAKNKDKIRERAAKAYADPVNKARRQAYAKIYYSLPMVKAKRKMHDHLKWLIIKANKQKYENRKRKV